ncbi:MAG: chemotaxis protein CheW [Pseudomonadota bacterium]
MNENALELNLINALGKLKHLALDKEFLDNKENVDPESVLEQYFAFAIGQYNFVVHSRFFCAVFIETSIAAIPNSPKALVGLSNIRGALTPIYQIYTVLGYPLPKKQFIFSVGKGDKSVGLLVDALPISLSLCEQDRAEKAAPPENVTLRSLVKHLYFSEGKLWHLLNGETLGQQLVGIASQDRKQMHLTAAKIMNSEIAAI